MKELEKYSDYSYVVQAYSYQEKREISRLIVMLPGAGCHFHKESGGCSMCGFHVATDRYGEGKLSSVETLREILLCGLKKIEGKEKSEVFFFNGGSFWNDQEIPKLFQIEAMLIISGCDYVGRIVIENRCEYITKMSLAATRAILGNKEFSVAVGLESSDDYVRNVLFRKGLLKANFEKAVRLMKECGVSPSVYVFLKPLGLSEFNALQDCLASIEYSLSIGIKDVYLSCAFVQEETEAVKEYAAGRFRPPWLWTILSVIEQAKENSWPLHVGNFDDSPPPIAIPENCPHCSATVYAAIEKYRRTAKIGNVPDCHCREEWKKIMVP